MSKLVYLIFEFFFPLMTIFRFFYLLFILLLLLLDLFFLLVKLDQSGRFVEAYHNKTDDSYKDIGFHVFWNVV